MTKKVTLFLILALAAFLLFKKCNNGNFNPRYELGEAIDSLHQVKVYYNGSVKNISGRNVIEGYNLGLKYQCVEFVKRYYYERYQHKMPNSYGHAISFFDPLVEDGQMNKQRNLRQYSNPSISKPRVGDLIVLNTTRSNKFGHVAIVSAVFDSEFEIIQQNAGAFAASRERYGLEKTDDGWRVENRRVLGWLRK